MGGAKISLRIVRDWLFGGQGTLHFYNLAVSQRERTVMCPQLLGPSPE